MPEHDKNGLLIVDEEIMQLREELKTYRAEIRALNSEELVKKVREEILKNFYTEIGRSVVKRILWIIGVVVVTLLMWLAGTGRLKPAGF